MHLSVDSKKPLESLRRDLLLACARAGLMVEVGTGPRPPAPPSSRAPASSPGPASSFVIQIADPLPELRATGTDPVDGRTWRISGYAHGSPAGEGRRSRISTIRPTQLLDLLGHPELSGPALRLEQILERVLKDAAGWDGAPTRP